MARAATATTISPTTRIHNAYRGSHTLAWRRARRRRSSGSTRAVGISCNFFVKGFLGVGGVLRGTLLDEDFPPQVDYSKTTSQTSGHLRYGSVDVGYNVYTGRAAEGRRLRRIDTWFELVVAKGCAQIGGNPFICAPAIPNGVTLINEKDRWNTARIGGALDFNLTSRLSWSGEIALTSVRQKAQDTHYFTFGAIPASGSGAGFEAESILKYRLTDNLSLGVGGRWWRYDTHAIDAFGQLLRYRTDHFSAFRASKLQVQPRQRPAGRHGAAALIAGPRFRAEIDVSLSHAYGYEQAACAAPVRTCAIARRSLASRKAKRAPRDENPRYRSRSDGPLEFRKLTCRQFAVVWQRSQTGPEAVCVRVVAAVAARAIRRQFQVRRIALVVAGLAFDLGVRAGQRVVRLEAVIVMPFLPIARVVAGFAHRRISETAFVHAVLVTGFAGARQLEIAAGRRVARLAADLRVGPGQRIMRLARVIVTRTLPLVRRVADLALRGDPEASLMDSVGVARLAGDRRILVELRAVAFFARNDLVLADQREARFGVIECDAFSPIRFVVALLACVAELAFMPILNCMT